MTFDDVISGQKAPLGWILRNIWLRMRTLKGAMTASRDLRSLPVAMILLLLYYILYYYYSKKKTREKLGHAQNTLPVTSGQGLSGNVTSCDVASGSSTSLNVV